jgi:hypothetical protein
MIFSVTSMLISGSGRDAWACGNLEDFGKLISESGRSSIDKYECGIFFSLMFQG